MKKRLQRCKVLRRFSALVAALMMCAALSVPCFASNNAQWRKWVVRAEKQMTNESGTMSTYFQLTPFQNGEIYAATILSHNASVNLTYENPSTGSTSSVASSVINCLNYPDWWRSAIPLGAVSYIQVDVKTITGGSTPFPSSPTSYSNASLYFFDRNNSIDITVDTAGYKSSSASSSLGFGGSLSQSNSDLYLLYGLDPSYNTAFGSSVFVEVGKSYTVNLSNMANVRFGFPLNFSNGGISVDKVYLTNLSSDRLVLGCIVSNTVYSSMSAEISFWVDANKLPAGLQVGDEFPADTDAFDQMRDELLDQFPEASENIVNGKSTLTGWNDTQTVGDDVASSASSVLAAIFQNLGTFLFTVSLMVFGAVVLRMFIKKAVS